MNSGINFNKLKKHGISQEEFAERVMASGLICNSNFSWIVFHGSYDFGYLLKLMSGEYLPETTSEFFNQLKIFFPKIQDIKHITAEILTLNGGLSKMATKLDVERVGTKHQAGSDSL